MATTIMNVEGMSCEHCVNAVTGAVSDLAGVHAVAVSLKDKTATIDYEPEKVSIDDLKDAIEEQGFDVVS